MTHPVDLHPYGQIVEGPAKWSQKCSNIETRTLRGLSSRGEVRAMFETGIVLDDRVQETSRELNIWQRESVSDCHDEDRSSIMVRADSKSTNQEDWRLTPQRRF